MLKVNSTRVGSLFKLSFFMRVVHREFDARQKVNGKKMTLLTPSGCGVLCCFCLFVLDSFALAALLNFQEAIYVCM